MNAGGRAGAIGGVRIADGTASNQFFDSLSALNSGVVQIAVSGEVVTASTYTATATRIPFGSGTNGGLTDSASLTWNDTTKTLTTASATSTTIISNGAGGITWEFNNATNMNIMTGGTLRFAFTSDGRFFGRALHNNGGGVTGATNHYVASGTYTPTLTNVTNVAASTARKCQWIRVGNVVTVSGSCDIDPTAAAATALGISLPIASNLALATDLGGTAAADGAVAIEAAAVRGDATNDRAEVSYIAVGIANHTVYFTFQYEVL